MAIDLRMGIRITASREQVFPFLLTPHHLARWFCNFAQVEPTVGGRFRFGGDYCIVAHPVEGGAWETTIRAGEVLRRFAFTWPLWDRATEVELAVEDLAGGSTLQASHLGLARDTSTCGSILDAWRMCLGNLKAIAEGREDSLRPDSYPVPQPEIKLDILVNAPAERTFRALTLADELDRWAASRSHVEPVAGGAYTLGWPSEDARLSAWNPPRTFRADWTLGRDRITTAFEVEEKGAARSAVHLRLQDWPPGEELAKGVRCRWSMRLVDLKNYLEAGETGFTEPRDAQTSGPGGRGA